MLLQADWRRPENPDEATKKYYAEGILPYERIKRLMNKPESGKYPMPTGALGVVNDYGPREKVKPGNKRDMENQMVDNLQWDMPEPQV